jgi:hypothetical protein
MIQNYLKVACRNLLRNKLYATINICGLAIGMASTVLIALWVQNEFSFDRHHTKSNQIYRINANLKISDTETWHWATTPLKFAEHFKKDLPEVKEATRLYIPYGDFTMHVGEEDFLEKSCAFVDKNWFEIFDYQFISGNASSFAQDKYNIALTESQSRKYFGNQNPIGKVVRHDSLNFTVAAVLKDLPSYTGFRYEVFMQNEVWLTNPQSLENESNLNNFNYQTFVVMPEVTDTKKISAKMTDLLKNLRKNEESQTTLLVQPLSEIHFDNTIQNDSLLHGSKQITQIFGIIAFFYTHSCLH